MFSNSKFSTSDTLLERLRHRDDDALWRQAWERFAEFYTPLIYFWARRAVATYPVAPSKDADDLVHDVFVTLLAKMPQFDYNASKSFRGWLHTVTLNQWRAWSRRNRLPMDGAAHLDEIPDPDMSAFEEKEFGAWVMRRALKLVEKDCDDVERRVFNERILARRTLEEVAADLGVLTGKVYRTERKVLDKLRAYLQGVAVH